ncbi:MAG TPA: MraY family glycosyltransferase [Candidatus Binatia bacterium]|jgi:UDP-GlcNAc:undecaprenyl-phosphate GlcNAc-1-phosphate transferase|nr:MraY family glycosyltransferase [Candidatus Binatia bacterium]
MNGIPIIGCGLLGLGIMLLLTPVILKTSVRARIARARDQHHTHTAQVCRLGGLALAATFLGLEFFIRFFLPVEHYAGPGRAVVILSSLAMFGLGFWDDLKPLGAKRKLLGQILIALVVYYFGVGIESFKIPFTERIIPLGGWGALVTVLWLVGITNLINLIDGVDGLASGICLMLMGLLVYVGYQNGTFVLLTAGMTGALLGFLWFNFPPARIYLGDGGAYFLGFQVGLFAIMGSHKGSILAALIAPLFVLALPIVDTSLAILRRGLRGLPLFRPDRRHLHHHLLRMGMSRRKVVLLFYAVTLVFLVMGFAAFWSRGHLVPVLVGLTLLLLLLCAGRLSFSREWFAVGRVVGNSLAMRQEIHYALSLTNWLEQEGKRSASVEDLCEDLAFAAHRIGFSYIKLTLADGSRVWGQPQPGANSVTQQLNGGSCGVLELQAATSQRIEGQPGPPDTESDWHPHCSPCIWDSRVFELTAELLAEAWVKAAHKWKPENANLSFDLKPPAVAGVYRRGQGALATARLSVRQARTPLPVLSDTSISG